MGGGQAIKKEQREAIKSLNEFANTKYGAFTAKEGQTVLSMLKEQQEENKKKDKIIDLMSEWISERCFYKDDYSNSCEIIQDSCSKEDNCKDCIKQYFERKVEEK